MELRRTSALVRRNSVLLRDKGLRPRHVYGPTQTLFRLTYLKVKR